MTGKLSGVHEKFYQGAWDVYRYALSSINQITADDELQAIAVKLAEICDLVKDAVADQNEGTLPLGLYDSRLADLLE